MAVRSERQTVIICDDCGATLTEALDRRQAIDLARESGWYVSRHRQLWSALCPKCKKRAQREEES